MHRPESTSLVRYLRQKNNISLGMEAVVKHVLAVATTSERKLGRLLTAMWQKVAARDLATE